MKNKFILIFLIVFMIVSCCSFTFASWDMTINETVYKFPDEFGKHQYKLFISYAEKPSSGYSREYYLIASDTPLWLEVKNSGSIGSSSPFYIWSYFVSDKTVITDFSSYKMSFEDYYNSYTGSYNTSIRTGVNEGVEADFLVYTTHDIYKRGTDELVFHRAPLQKVEPMKIRQVEEIQPMIIQLVEAILPAILMMMGVLLIIFLLRYKNFLQM